MAAMVSAPESGREREASECEEAARRVARAIVVSVGDLGAKPIRHSAILS